LYNDFSNGVEEYMNRLSIDMTGIASLATGLLISAYGADRFQIIPKMLNMDAYTVDFTEQYHSFSLSNFVLLDDNTSDIIHHGYLGIEYLYDYKFEEYSDLIDVLNIYLEDTFDITTDILKYIVPKISFLSGRNLTSNEKYFGVSRIDRPLNNYSIYLCRNVLSG